jgi:hypothetical protein
LQANLHSQILHEVHFPVDHIEGKTELRDFGGAEEEIQNENFLFLINVSLAAIYNFEDKGIILIPESTDVVSSLKHGDVCVSEASEERGAADGRRSASDQRNL